MCVGVLCVQMFKLNMHFIISVKAIFATYKNLIIPAMFELTEIHVHLFPLMRSKMLSQVFFILFFALVHKNVRLIRPITVVHIE